MSSPASARLAALQVEVAALRARVEALEKTGSNATRLRRPAPANDAALLSAIAVSIGASIFGAVDLLAVRDGELPALLDGLDARRVGSRLRRIHRQHGATRYRLEKIGRDGRGILWALYVTTYTLTYIGPFDAADNRRMRYAKDLLMQSEHDRRATAAVAAALCRDSFLTVEPLSTFRRRGFDEYDHLFTKAAVDPLTSDNAGLAGGPLEQAFMGAVDRASIMDALMSGGAVTMPVGPTGAGRILLGTVSGSTPEEQAAKPVMTIDFNVSTAPQKAVAMIVTSAEAARSFDMATQDGIRAHLVSAAAAAVNTRLVAAFTSGTPESSAAVGALLAAVSNGAPRRPAIIGGYAELLALDAGTLRDLDLLNVALLPCAEASGYLIAVDMSGLLLADAGAVVEVARHASLALDDTGAGEPTFNLFQRNCIAIRAERWFTISLRPDAVAFASTGSPA